jgi:hypothetical protein
MLLDLGRTLAITGGLLEIGARLAGYGGHTDNDQRFPLDVPKRECFVTSRQEGSMQRLWVNIDGDIQELCVPAEIEEVVPGVSWGRPDDLFTPSFWKYQSEAQVRRNRYSFHRLGSNLLEEIAVCLLGGLWRSCRDGDGGI